MKKIMLMTFIIMMLTMPIAFGIAIVDVACGDNHTVLLAEDGTVWTMGDNSVGQCGPTSVGGCIDTPTKILRIPKMQSIYAGGNKTFLVDRDNANSYELVDGVLKPLGLSDITDISISPDGKRAVILNKDGEVYGIGEAGTGESIDNASYYYISNADYYMGLLGYVEKSSRKFSWQWQLDFPQKIEINEIKEVYWENNGLVCVDINGTMIKCYKTNVSWYTNETKPVIIRNSSTVITDAQKKYANCRNDIYNSNVKDDFSVSTATKKTITIDEFIAYPTDDLILTTDGAIYDNQTGLLERNYHVYDEVIVAADSGANHKILLDENGNVYAYGNNDYGQLGIKKASGDTELVYIETPVQTGGYVIQESNGTWSWSQYSGNNDYVPGFLLKFFGLVKKGNELQYRYFSEAIPSSASKGIEHMIYLGTTEVIKVPTLIESLQEIVPNEQSSLVYITSDARVWIGGIANFSLMFEVEEDMTLRNTANNLHDIFSNGSLNVKVYDKEGKHLTQAQGVVYNVYEDGVNISQTITPNFVFKSGKTYQLECGIGNCFDVRGDTYTVKVEGMNASKVKDGVITQMRSSVNIAKFILKVYVTELANLT